MVRRYLEETGIPKVTGRDDHLGETFCKWDLGIEAGTLPNSRWHFCLRPCLHYQDWQPLLLAKVISTLEPTCHSHHHLVTYYGLCQFLQHPQFLSACPGGSPQPFWIGQHKESCCSGSPLISSKCVVSEGGGGREVMWDIWDHGSLQEDWKESCKGFRTVWSEREPEVPDWQLSEPAQISRFLTGKKSTTFAVSPSF